MSCLHVKDPLSWRRFVQEGKAAGRENPPEGMRMTFLSFMESAEAILGGDSAAGGAESLLEGLGRTTTKRQVVQPLVPFL